jgi:CTP:molybdopterin cytidylyltransferase MocA
MAKVDILIPAAGAARRMRGADKLMERIDGEPQLRRIARMAARVAAETAGSRVAHVFVTLPQTGPFAPGRRAALAGLSLRILAIADAHEGMAASLRAGAHAVVDAEGLMVVPADMPDLTGADLALMVERFRTDPSRVLRATAAAGTPGHPVIFPRRLFGALQVLSGEEGGRKVLVGEDVATCALPAEHAVCDLDTPEDWAEWRVRRGTRPA